MMKTYFREWKTNCRGRSLQAQAHREGDPQRRGGRPLLRGGPAEAGRGLPPQENTNGHLQVRMNTVQNGNGSKPRNNWGKNWDARWDAIDWQRDKAGGKRSGSANQTKQDNGTNQR